MTSSAYNTAQSYQNGDRIPTGFADRYDWPQRFIRRFLTGFERKLSQSHKPHSTSSKSQPARNLWTLRSLFNIPFGLVLVWLLVLRWGEQTIFKRMIQDCAWDRWESWVRI